MAGEKVEGYGGHGACTSKYCRIVIYRKLTDFVVT
jgi:hypothetical protein